MVVTSIPRSLPLANSFSKRVRGALTSAADLKSYNYEGDITLTNDIAGTQQYLLNIPVQGSDAINREGNRIWCKSIDIRGQVIFPSTTATADSSATWARIVLVRAKHINPTSVELFNDPVDTDLDALASFNMSYVPAKYQILADLQLRALPRPAGSAAAGVIATAASVTPFRIVRKLGFQTTFFNTNGNPLTNGVFLVALVGNPTATGTTNMRWTAQTMFMG